MRSGAVAALTAFLVIGPSAVPAAAKDPEPATPEHWDPRVEEIAEQVEKLRGLDFEHPVDVEFLSDEAFEERVRTDGEERSKEERDDFDTWIGEMHALGLVTGDLDVFDTYDDVSAGSILAYYDPETKTITVRGEEFGVDTKVTMAHELTHTLQDQHFDLSELNDGAIENDYEYPLDVLVEGDATRVDEAYLDDLPESEQEQFYEHAIAELTEGIPIPSDPPDAEDALSVAEAYFIDVIETFQLAPYVLGPLIARSLVKLGGLDVLDEWFRRPPRTEEQVIDLVALVDAERAEKVPTPKLDKGDERVGDPMPFGALYLYVVLASRIDAATALSAADGWGGDRMVTYRKGGEKGPVCVRARFVGDDEDATADIGRALTAWAVAMPSGASAVRVEADRVDLRACEPEEDAGVPPTLASDALELLELRNTMATDGVEEDVPVDTAVCVADAAMRDQEFRELADWFHSHGEWDANKLARFGALITQTASGCG